MKNHLSILVIHHDIFVPSTMIKFIYVYRKRTNARILVLSQKRLLKIYIYMLFVIAIVHFFYWNTQTENTQKHLDVTKVLGGNRRNGQVTHSTGSYQNKKRTVVFYFFLRPIPTFTSVVKNEFFFFKTHTRIRKDVNSWRNLCRLPSRSWCCLLFSYFLKMYFKCRGSLFLTIKRHRFIVICSRMRRT